MGNELLIKLREELKKNLVEEKAARFDEEYSYLLRERDTSDVWRQFAIWLLVDPEYGVIRFTKPGTPQYHAIQQVAQLYIEDCKDIKRWEAAYDAAWSAAAFYAADASSAAAKAAYYAAGSAGSAAYACAAAATAEDAADDAWYAARADAFAAAFYAFYADSAAHYQLIADKLIELLHAAPIMKEPV